MKQKAQLKISKKEVNKQVELLAKGTQFVKLKNSCIRGIGIGLFSKSDINLYKNKYENALRNGKSTIKFVPASGAASRMFKHLYNIKSPSKSVKLINHFFDEITHFPFYKELEKKLNADKLILSNLIKNKKYQIIANKILSSNGLDYGNVPKGMVKFHRYENKSRTAFEEHLIEGLNYCKNNKNEVNIHFTISDEHSNLIKKHVLKAKQKIEKEFGVTFSISYSKQDPLTNTVAVDLVNKPLKDENGNLIFRPGGHGSLLNNLNNLDADLIFIKNIDNVSAERYNEKNNTYKKAVAGKLIELQDNVFYILKRLNENRINSQLLHCVKLFLEVKFRHAFPENFDSLKPAQRVAYFINQLNRPIRVCGMVKNEGEPGGGPFVVENKHGKSLQIVESSQVDLNDRSQAKIWNSSTHFNPVDIVCGIKNYKGEKFDLTQFVDPSTVFISKKSNNGSDLKALEWPGLWNGSMSEWLTTFIEVPAVTFNPVKTVNDLLREEHQAA